MGYYMTQHNSEVTILRKDFDAALAALKQAQKAGTRWGWCNDISDCQSLSEALKELRWSPIFNDDGICNLIFNGEKLGDDQSIFDHLAPYVQDGSFIMMFGEDGDVWRWGFEDGKCFERGLNANDIEALLSKEDSITITLEVFDDEGIVVDSTPADLTAAAVEDIVTQAVIVVREADKGAKKKDLLQYIAELREALESHSVIEPK